MEKEYGELMTLLLQRRDLSDTDEKFRGFVIESVRTLARDLKDLNVDLSIKPDAMSAKPSSKDWNYLKIGCE
jgi:hypothetical protein